MENLYIHLKHCHSWWFIGFSITSPFAMHISHFKARVHIYLFIYSERYRVHNTLWKNVPWSKTRKSYYATWMSNVYCFCTYYGENIFFHYISSNATSVLCIIFRIFIINFKWDRNEQVYGICNSGLEDVSYILHSIHS